MKIESFEHACELLLKLTGEDYSKPVIQNIPGDMGSALLSQYKLWVIAKASREGKKLDVGYYPYFFLDRASSGSGFSFRGNYFVGGSTGAGSRQEFPDIDTSEYSGKQHIQLYKDVMVIKSNK